MVFFILVLVILVFVVVWNFDVHKILHVKSISQNGGDAAALAAARWQGISLNLIGDLNVLHAAAICDGDTGAAAAITNIQARLCYVGPMIAFMASQQAAKNNGIYENPDFSEELSEHARMVRNDYARPIGGTGTMLFPEPYEGCWEEYADMLQLVADDGVAAGPDNIRMYSDYVGGHVLLDIGFYEAVAARNWCWFYHNEPDLLEEYENFFPCWWDPLPFLVRRYYNNSEIFGLGVAGRFSAMNDLVDLDTIEDVAADRGLDVNITNDNMEATWYVYVNSRWQPWSAMSLETDDPFPLTGPVKPQYDYTGADAAVRVEARTGRLTPGHGRPVTNTIVWTASAKPFGYLEDDLPPHACGMVLPAFHDVALFPVDASSAPSGGGYNLAWRDHVEEHLPRYMSRGPSGGGCYYCGQLTIWENESFRESGIEWLKRNSDQCTATGGGGGGGGHGGGTRRGH